MAKSSLPPDSPISGVRKRFSKRLNQEVWGFDIYINNQRYRRHGFMTKREAEEAVKRFRLAECKRKTKVISGPSEMANLPLQPVDKSCKLGSIGACAEMVICADLLRRGYDVYRSLSPNADCDLIISFKGKLCRVEVKSAIYKRGRPMFRRERLDQTKFDMLALAFLRESRVIYQPSLAEFFKEPDPIIS